jgi:hypothetical protein
LIVEVGVIFKGIIRDQKATINYHPNGGDLIPTIFDYIKQVQISLCNTAFTVNLLLIRASTGPIKIEKQYLFKPTLHRVLY